MKKIFAPLLLFVIIFSFSIGVKAETIITEVVVDVGGELATTDVRYKTEFVYLDVKTSDGQIYTIKFVKELVDPAGVTKSKMKIPADLTRQYLLDTYGQSTLDKIMADSGVRAFTRGEFKIYKASTNQELNRINTKDKITSIAHDVYGFSGKHIINMEEWFREVQFPFKNVVPVQPIKKEQNMILKAALKEFDDNSLNNNVFLITNPQSYAGYSIDNPLVIKAGYGIPITAEIQGFNYNYRNDCCCHRTRYRNFRMDPTITVEIDELDEFWKDGVHSVEGIDTLDLLWPWEQRYGDLFWKQNEYVHGGLKHQVNSDGINIYPLGKRMIYTSPVQKDGIFKITIKAVTNVSFEEYLAVEHHPCDCEEDPTCCHGHDSEWISQNETYTDTVDLYVQIMGSMYDDDQQLISR